MKKVLLVTTVSGFVPQFELNNVHILQNMGYEVHYAANYKTPSYGNDNHRLDGTGIVRHQIDFVRSPFKTQNLTVYRQLCQLMQQRRVGCALNLAARAEDQTGMGRCDLRGKKPTAGIALTMGIDFRAKHCFFKMVCPRQIRM